MHSIWCKILHISDSLISKCIRSAIIKTYSIRLLFSIIGKFVLQKLEFLNINVCPLSMFYAPRSPAF